MKAKKLIEVAMPIKEISAESVRDKYIHHGHISTLHIWWARRPLPVCRAAVFASLVFDPLDEHCPFAFVDAVRDLLGNDSRLIPYKDIPYTAGVDRMEDNLRNRLLMFVAKFSDKSQQDMINGSALSKDSLQDYSLVKSESKDNDQILTLARKLIWIAYNSERFPEKSYTQLSNAFQIAYDAIFSAEEQLYSIINRHIVSADVVSCEEKLRDAIDSFQTNMPSVFDPFLAVVPFLLRQQDLAVEVLAMILIQSLILLKKGHWNSHNYMVNQLLTQERNLISYMAI